MQRDAIQREIAEIDGELNRVLGSTTLPSLEVKPFPKGTWLLAFLSAAWWMFGSDLPVISNYHSQYGDWGMYAAVAFGILGLMTTLSWLFRRRGGMSTEYAQASEKARVLQERRRELQVELRELEAE
ncbi:MAG: hypothetical protein ACR2IE_13145 [Candidatus Sumerlaeaceae bacterium]